MQFLISHAHHGLINSYERKKERERGKPGKAQHRFVASEQRKHLLLREEPAPATAARSLGCPGLFIGHSYMAEQCSASRFFSCHSLDRSSELKGLGTLCLTPNTNVYRFCSSINKSLLGNKQWRAVDTSIEYCEKRLPLKYIT